MDNVTFLAHIELTLGRWAYHGFMNDFMWAEGTNRDTADSADDLDDLPDLVMITGTVDYR